MPRTASVTHFVAISDLSQPPNTQSGILIEVAGKGGNSRQNRAKALEIALKMWQNGEIEEDQFPDGLTEENIVYVPSDNDPVESPQNSQKTTKIPPIVRGAQEIVELTKLQLDVQDLAQEAEIYLPIIQAVLGRTRPLTTKEKELVQDKQFAKTLEKLALTIAKQEQYREEGFKYAQLILNAIAWQLNKGLKTPVGTQKTSGKTPRPKQVRNTRSASKPKP